MEHWPKNVILNPFKEFDAANLIHHGTQDKLSYPHFIDILSSILPFL